MEQEMILKKSFVFSLDIIQYSELLEQQKKYSIAKQLLDTGTTFGANINDARYSKTDKDFIYNIKNSMKNAQKARYWLLLCKYSNLYPNPDNLITEIEELLELISEPLMINRNL